MDRLMVLRAAVDTVLETLRQHGFTPTLWNTEGGWERLLSNPSDEIMSVEDCHMMFRHAEHKGGWIRFIPDVSCPCDLICDHSMPADGHFTAAVDAAIKAIEEES